jgi:hypothetical protein
MRTKASAIILSIALVSVCFMIRGTEEAQASKFVESMSANGLNPNFMPQDVVWNDEGTMACVVGQDSSNGPTAYIYWPDNGTWTPVGGYSPGQHLMGVDYFNGSANPIFPSDVLVVDADSANEGLVNYYIWPLENNSARVTVWDVYGNSGPAKGKPISTDMDPYDMVMWVPSRFMNFGAPPYQFDTNDEYQVGMYLTNGGSFFLSNVWYMNLHLSSPYFSPGDFPYDYLGIGDIGLDGNYENYIMGMGGDEAFGGMGPFYLNWYKAGWSGFQPYTSDYISMFWSNPCIYAFNNGGSSQYGGIKTQGGNWKTMFLGVPFETLEWYDADDFMGRLLDWVCPPPLVYSPANVLLVDADYQNSGIVDIYNSTLTSLTATVTIWDVYGNRGPAMGKPNYIMMDPYEIVIWVPSKDMMGPPTNAFDSNDEYEVSVYLNNGGCFFLSNIRWTDFTAGGGSYSPGYFPYDYFGIQNVNRWTNYEWYLAGYGGDGVYSGMGPYTLNWNRGGWVGRWGESDSLSSCGIPAMNSFDEFWTSTVAAARYMNVNWKTVFMGIPFEVLEPADGQELMRRTLEWFKPGCTEPPEGARFWLCGDMTGSPPTCVYYIDPAHPNVMTYDDAVSGTFWTIACDEWGHPLAAGDGMAWMWYHDGDSWQPVNGAGLSSNLFTGMDYDPISDRFYTVSKWWNGSAYRGGLYYTDPAPLIGGGNCYKDSSGYPETRDDFEGLAWNIPNGFGLVVGHNGVYKIPSYSGNQSFNWTKVLCINDTGNWYRDVSWDTDGWIEAAIVGDTSFSTGGYWRYYTTTDQVSMGHTDNTVTWFLCAGVKPPSSPKWVFIPKTGGGWKVNILENYEGSQLYLEASSPIIFSIDFRDQGTGITRLNQQIDANHSYTFFVEANYTQGAVDRWNFLNIQLNAWFDEGNVGVASGPAPFIPSVAENRTRQFRLTYNVSTQMTDVDYPQGYPNEFDSLSTWEDPAVYGIEARHLIYINVTFKEQTRAASGNNFVNGSATAGNIWDKNSALNDPNSWDFNFTAYDFTNTLARNTTWEEFGVKQAVSIIASGNPTGASPPGAGQFLLSNPSQVTYSANTNYTLNVSLKTQILKDGIGPELIGVSNISVRNENTQSNLTNSDIPWASAPSPFTAPGEVNGKCVWGRTPTGQMLNPPNNGTIAAGPWGSNYNAVQITPINWWASIPAGTAHGTYWAIITFTIQYP